MRAWLQLLKGIDWPLMAATLLLAGFSLLVLYSISNSETAQYESYFRRQALFVVIGILVMFLVTTINYQWWWASSTLLYSLGTISLVAVLLLGEEVRGSRSWFVFGSFQLQPVEFVKIILLIVLAKYFAKYADELHRPRHLLISGLFTALPVGLVLMQGDAGSAAIVAALWIGLIVIAGIRQKTMLVLIPILLVLLVGAWFFVLGDVQRGRVLSFISPEEDTLGAGYNRLQSMIAIGSGGVMGKGLGYGSQSQLLFLPEPHTDFVFAVIAEELGFVGVLLFFTLLGFLFYRLIRVGMLAQRTFGKLIIGGVVTLFAVGLTVNIGMNLGVLPVTGIPLPLISYGGSSLTASFLLLGIVQSVAVQGRRFLGALDA